MLLGAAVYRVQLKLCLLYPEDCVKLLVWRKGNGEGEKILFLFP